jgi:hypothetical protein
MSNRALRPIPLRPDPNALGERDVTSLVRAAMAFGRAAMGVRQTPSQIASSLWPNDDHTALLIRAVTMPTALTNAAQLARISAEFLAAMAPLARRC